MPGKLSSDEKTSILSQQIHTLLGEVVQLKNFIESPVATYATVATPAARQTVPLSDSLRPKVDGTFTKKNNPVRVFAEAGGSIEDITKHLDKNTLTTAEKCDVHMVCGSRETWGNKSLEEIKQAFLKLKENLCNRKGWIKTWVKTWISSILPSQSIDTADRCRESNHFLKTTYSNASREPLRKFPFPRWITRHVCVRTGTWRTLGIRSCRTFCSDFA